MFSDDTAHESTYPANVIEASIVAVRDELLAIHCEAKSTAALEWLAKFERWRQAWLDRLALLRTRAIERDVCDSILASFVRMHLLQLESEIELLRSTVLADRIHHVMTRN